MTSVNSERKGEKVSAVNRCEKGQPARKQLKDGVCTPDQGANDILSRCRLNHPMSDFQISIKE